MTLDLDKIPELAEQYKDKDPNDILDHAYSLFPSDKIAISFSGAEDVVLVDMAVANGIKPRVFSLDTGRLHKETYEFIERVRKHYGINIELYSPQAEPLQKFVKEKGLFSFYRDGHTECCEVRKVEPLRRALGTLDAWITGQRKDQSPTRKNVPAVQVDSFFGTKEKPLVKFNPLTDWTSQQVWEYLIVNKVPINELQRAVYNAGGDYTKLGFPAYVSIGCEPCTTMLMPGEHERMARWRSEESTKKECGLHAGNVEKP